ncbi:hypothetical protein ACGFSI_10855 [Streptomyces virginiae]|uniref:hypothetical protein n=1 Tax=Streptomyces virginiae TaxID=1961 RepID=UPI00371E6010
MIICGDDGLAHRLAQELDAVCGEADTVVLPSRREGHGAEVVALHRDPRSSAELLISARPDEQTLREAGVERAAAVALTYGDAARVADSMAVAVARCTYEGKPSQFVVEIYPPIKASDVPERREALTRLMTVYFPAAQKAVGCAS